MEKQLFPLVECIHGPECICPANERALLRFKYGSWPHGPMTPEQREWCIDEADWAGEGAYHRNELEAMSDQELASTTYHAWVDYCRSQGML